MTKRDYILIAQCIAQARTEYDPHCQYYADIVLGALALRMASALREGNRRFDIERFTTACKQEQSLDSDASWLRSLP